MVVIGGNADKYIDPNGRYPDNEIIRSDGSTCVPSSGSPIPNLPKSLKNFALASRKDRYIYLCGGNYLTYTGREYFFSHSPNPMRSAKDKLEDMDVSLIKEGV